MSFTKKIENTANILIIVLAIILAVILIKKYFLPFSANQSIKIGEKVSINEIDFTKAEKTILVALQPGCHFCEESAGFYQNLLNKVESANNSQIIAVFSREIKDEKQFLDKLNLNFKNIKKISFFDLQIDATPTILVVKKDGTIESVWIGKLSDEKENEFINKLE